MNKCYGCLLCYDPDPSCHRMAKDDTLICPCFECLVKTMCASGCYKFREMVERVEKIEKKEWDSRWEDKEIKS